MAEGPPRHLEAVDPVRLLTVVGVVAVHAVSSTTAAASVPAGAVIVGLHVNRDIFFLLTALVLAYSYGARPLRLGRFYARRYWLIVTPYLAWTAVYFAAGGGLRLPAAQALRGLAYDVATGGASYHLYFLLVTVQTYLAFPVLPGCRCASPPAWSRCWRSSWGRSWWRRHSPPRCAPAGPRPPASRRRPRPRAPPRRRRPPLRA